MKNTLLFLGTAALVAVAAPAAAKPGHAKGHGNHHAGMNHKDHAKAMYGYGNGACPPGLKKQNAMCMPPGQYKKLYNVGQRYRANYGNLWSYDQIPYDLRTRYGFNPDYRYYYGDGYLYQVDPRTMLIQQVVNAILR